MSLLASLLGTSKRSGEATRTVRATIRKSKIRQWYGDNPKQQRQRTWLHGYLWTAGIRDSKDQTENYRLSQQ